MARSAAFHVSSEVLSVELIAKQHDLQLNAGDRLFTLEPQLERVVAATRLSPNAAAEVREMCGRLDRAKTAIVATSHHGLSKTPTTLAFCVNTALKLKNGVSATEAGVATCPIAVNAAGNVAPSKRGLAHVIIVAPDEKHGEHLASLLHHLVVTNDLPLKCERNITDTDRRHWSDHDEIADIAIYENSELSLILESHLRLAAMKETHLIMWDEAHRLFGPDFRRPCHYYGVYQVISQLKRVHPAMHSILVGPRDQFKSMSVMRDELFGSRGYKLVFDEDRSGWSVLGKDLRYSRPPSPQVVNQKTSDSLPLRVSKHVGFLDLPGEVRNQIYDYAIESGAVFKIEIFVPAGRKKPARAVCEDFTNIFWHEHLIFDHDLGKWKNMPPREKSRTLGLSYVSKQLACETRGIFYERNSFEFETIAGLNIFIKSIGSPRASLRDVKIVGKQGFLYTNPWRVFRKFEPLASLQRLCIDSASFATGNQVARGQIQIEQFAYEIKDFLLKWHDKHKDSEGVSGVLDLVKVFEACHKCEQVVDCDTQNCSGGSDVCRAYHYEKPGSRTWCFAFARRWRRYGCRVKRTRKLRQMVRERITETLGMAC